MKNNPSRGRTRTPLAATGSSAASSQLARRTQSVALVLRIPRRLDSPNTWHGAHWRVKHTISQAWEHEIWLAAAQQGKRAPKAPGRMRVTVTRYVKSARNLIRDDDNLAFAVKPLNDALKRLGYLRDDSRTWLEQPTPTQHVSDDGTDYTVIIIEPAT